MLSSLNLSDGHKTGSEFFGGICEKFSSFSFSFSSENGSFGFFLSLEHNEFGTLSSLLSNLFGIN